MGASFTVSFKYDPFGRRIYKSSSTATSIFAYDGDNLIEETNSSGTAVARYSQGLNIDEPLAILRSSATSCYDADGHGSITSISTSAGSLAQTYTFDSFGKLTTSSGSLTNPFQYTARELDPETSLYYYRARYYDPNVGRFLSEDPLRFDSDSANFYLYVTNRPSSLIDPLGLGPQSPIPPQPILPILMCPFCTQVTLGGNDMWNNYRRMEQTKWIKGDKYYHCFANCQATNQRPGGALAAKVIGFVRTDVISRVREPGDWRNDDVANKCGQQGGVTATKHVNSSSRTIQPENRLSNGSQEHD